MADFRRPRAARSRFCRYRVIRIVDGCIRDLVIDSLAHGLKANGNEKPVRNGLELCKQKNGKRGPRTSAKSTGLQPPSAGTPLKRGESADARIVYWAENGRLSAAGGLAFTPPGLPAFSGRHGGRPLRGAAAGGDTVRPHRPRGAGSVSLRDADVAEPGLAVVVLQADEALAQAALEGGDGVGVEILHHPAVDRDPHLRAAALDLGRVPLERLTAGVLTRRQHHVDRPGGVAIGRIGVPAADLHLETEPRAAAIKGVTRRKTPQLPSLAILKSRRRMKELNRSRVRSHCPPRPRQWICPFSTRATAQLG